MDIQDRKKSLTVEELRQRYNLEDISKNKKAIQVQKDSITKLDAHLEDFIDATVENLQELQDQVDGNITTWFYSGVPTLLNEPAVEWETDTDKDKHLGDLYYDQATGYAYRFQKTNNVYSWLKLTDSDVTEALAIANAAQDTADSKRRVFVVQPTPPYDIGDIWIKEDKDLYRCQTATVEGGTYNPSHWILATNYTDDTVALQAKQELDQFKVDVEETYATNAELVTTTNSITGRVEETYTYITTVENNIQNQIGDITTTTQVSTGKNSLYTKEAVEGNALGYLVDGATEQQTYSGKNKLNYLTSVTGAIAVNSTTEQLNGDTKAITSAWIPCKPNTSYTISGGNNRQRWQTKDSNSTITYVSDSSATITTNAEAAYLRCYYYYSSSNINPTSITNVQIEEGTTATSYEPYVGGTPSPNPDYPQEVKTIPSIMNLFDKNNVMEGYRIGSNGLPYATTGYNLSDFIPVQPDTTYTRNFINTGNSTTAYYDANKNFIERIGNTNTGTFTTTGETYYIRTAIADGNLNSLMIEKGSVSHEYVPYGYWSKVKVTGKNIFDKDNANILNATINSSSKLIGTSNQYKLVYISVEANTTYTVSKTQSDYLSVGYTTQLPTTGVSVSGYINIVSGDTTKATITTGNNAQYLVLRYYRTTDTLTEEEIRNSIQIEEGNQATNFEAYKENQVLIDMSKENLINIDTLDFENAYYSSTGTLTANNLNGLIQYISVQPSTTYTITKNITTNNASIVEFNGSKTFIQRTVKYDTSTGGNNEITFTTTSTTQYLAIFYNYDNSTNVTKTMLESWNIKLFQSNNPTPYYELCKIGDYKDILSIDSSGNCTINKNIGKVLLNGSESIFSMGWASPKYAYAINVSNIKQTTNSDDTANLFCDYYAPHSQNDIFNTYNYSIGRRTNNGQVIIRNDDITSINSLKTWLSTHNTSVYYPLATPETINLPNTQIPLFDGINHVTLVDDLETDTSISLYRKTPLTGTYATVTQLKDLDKQKTTQITQIRNEMLVDLNTERLRIDSINQTIDETGVPILNTGTGYVFDSEGLKIEKTNQDVKSQLDNDGLSVKYNDADVLTARSDGVNAVNMTVNKFYVQRPIRMEKTKSISDGSSVGLGFFYVGEE